MKSTPKKSTHEKLGPASLSIAKWILSGSEGWNWLLPFGERILNFNAAIRRRRRQSQEEEQPFLSGLKNKHTRAYALFH